MSSTRFQLQLAVLWLIKVQARLHAHFSGAVLLILWFYSVAIAVLAGELM
jgi:hypothetical protein